MWQHSTKTYHTCQKCSPTGLRTCTKPSKIKQISPSTLKCLAFHRKWKIISLFLYILAWDVFSSKIETKFMDFTMMWAVVIWYFSNFNLRFVFIRKSKFAFSEFNMKLNLFDFQFLPFQIWTFIPFPIFALSDLNMKCNLMDFHFLPSQISACLL